MSNNFPCWRAELTSASLVRLSPVLAVLVTFYEDDMLVSIQDLLMFRSRLFSPYIEGGCKHRHQQLVQYTVSNVMQTCGGMFPDLISDSLHCFPVITLVHYPSMGGKKWPTTFRYARCLEFCYKIYPGARTGREPECCTAVYCLATLSPANNWTK
jgi:hypothetical protein